MKHCKVLLSLILLLTANFTIEGKNKQPQSNTVIKNLQIEFTKNPIGIDDTNPRFCWIMESNIRDTYQSSYQIIVSTDAAGSSVIWNSGVITSSESTNIKYTGNNLLPSTRYYWHVNVVDNRGNSITSKEKAYFETGLLSSGWSGAQWIQRMDNDAKSEDSANFNLEMNVTLLSDNIGIIFGAKDAKNMHMWSINTHDNSYPILRRHIYVEGNLTSEDISLNNFFTKENLLNKEFIFKINVKENIVYTYINNILIDTYKSPTLRNGHIGFRAYKGNNIDEKAYIDNIVLSTYKPDQKGNLQPTTVKENFENGSNDFEGTETVKINGNTKLNLYSKNGDSRYLQSAASNISLFRSEFSLSKQIKSARIYSSGLGIYDLFINGKRVGRTMEDGTIIYDELKPGWTDYKKTVFYTTYDATQFLVKGQNAIGAVVSSGWLNGEIAHSEYGDPNLGFIAKLVVKYTDGTSETLVTNTDTWLSSNQSPIRLASIYSGESYDARLESNWTSSEFDDSKWNKVSVNPYFKGNVTAFIAPPVQIRPELNQIPKMITIYNGIKNTNSTYGEVAVVKTIKGTSPVKLKQGETVIYDFGQNIVGWINLKVKGASGTKLRARFSEMLNDSGEASRRNDNAKGTLYLENLREAKATLHYTLKGNVAGEEFRPSMSFFGFRYCEITAPYDIEIETIVGEVIGTVNDEKSSLKTSDKLINQLYSNIIWGQRGNYISIPTDCPQRDERLGWTGDTQVFCRAATYNANVASFFRKWMGDMRDSQRSDGAYPSVAPNTWGVPYGQSAWSEAGIIIPWNMYLVYGDKNIIEENYVSMEAYMNFLANQKGDGYLYNGSGTSFGDWLSYEKTDSRYISVCYYAYAAQLMAKMAKAIGKEQDLTKYKTLYNNIKAEFQTRYVNAEGTLKETSQTAYLLALKLDLFPSDKDTKNAENYLVNKIANNGNKLSTGFVGTGILNQTLSEFGAANTAYNLLLQRADPSWLYSVDQGATTIWERWNSYTIEKGFGEPGMNSFNHYAYGAVAEWMYRFMAGIDADENTPGFKHIILQPSPDTRPELPLGQERITNVEATYASLYGNVESKWTQKSDNHISYEITIPANTTATLYLSKPKKDDYVYEKRKRAEDIEGVISIKERNNKFILELKSGSYTFDVTNNHK